MKKPAGSQEGKGDIKRWKGHGDNGQIIKLVYVHEGYEESEAIERIYFQSDGGGWMKKGMEMLGGSYVGET